MKLFVGKKFLNPEKKRRSITKKFIVLNFLLLCAFRFGHAADWAPDSLEGKFIKLIEEHEPGVEIETPDGYSYTSSYAKYIDYYYVEDGSARSGTSKDHVLSPLALSYSKTGPKSFSVDFSSEYTKLYSEKITGIMIDEKQAIATHYYEVTSLGHPYQGASINTDQMGIVLKLEFLDNQPSRLRLKVELIPILIGYYQKMVGRISKLKNIILNIRYQLIKIGLVSGFQLHLYGQSLLKLNFNWN